MNPYYQDDAVTIYHGDCRGVLASGVRADSAIFDPPYGVGMTYGDSYDDDRDTYWEWFLPTLETIRAAVRLTCFTHRVRALEHVRGWDCVGVWNKPLSMSNRLGNSMILPHWEPIFMFGIHGRGPLDGYTSDVFAYNPERGGTSRVTSGGTVKGRDTGGHPCPKPFKLMLALVKSFSALGETVLDPFMGSGTTLRAAKDLGRKAIGIEIEERYCEMAARRMQQECLPLEAKR